MKLEHHTDVPDLKEHWQHLFAATNGLVQHRLGYTVDHQWRRMEMVLAWVADLGHMRRGIEVGCCEGMMTERLAAHFDDLLAIDFVSDFFDLCPKIEGVRYEERDAETWTPTQTVDLVVMSEVLEHLRDPVGALRRFASQSERVLATCPINEELTTDTWDVGLLRMDESHPSLGLAIGATAGHVWAMDWEGFLQMFAQAGLTVEREAYDGVNGFILGHR